MYCSFICSFIRSFILSLLKQVIDVGNMKELFMQATEKVLSKRIEQLDTSSFKFRSEFVHPFVSRLSFICFLLCSYTISFIHLFVRSTPACALH